MFDYTAAFQSAVDQVKGEGRYRVFADLKRVRGQFPKAVRRLDDGSEQDCVIWCSKAAGNLVRATSVGEQYMDVGTVEGYHIAQDFLRGRALAALDEAA